MPRKSEKLYHYRAKSYTAKEAREQFGLPSWTFESYDSRDIEICLRNWKSRKRKNAYTFAGETHTSKEWAEAIGCTAGGFRVMIGAAERQAGDRDIAMKAVLRYYRDRNKGLSITLKEQVRCLQSKK